MKYVEPARMHPTSREMWLDALSECLNLSADDKVSLQTGLAQSDKSVQSLILQLGICDQSKLTEIYAVQFAIHPIDFKDDAPDRKQTIEHIKTLGLSEEYCRRQMIIPVCYGDLFPLPDESRSEDGQLILVTTDPTDYLMTDALKMRCGQSVYFATLSVDSIDAFWAEDEDVNGLSAAIEMPGLAALSPDDISRLEDLATDAPVVNCLERLVASGLKSNASDLHIVSVKAGFAVRYRIDGALRQTELLTSDLGTGLLSRLKILANLDITERRIPQDGRIRLRIAGETVDIRMATMPHAEREGAVLRFLKQSEALSVIDSLGFSKDVDQGLKSALGAPDGLILVCGPTGSGKSTTLYACLNHIRAPELNIVTIENPIEQRIDGIVQVEVNAEIGLDFPDALRAMLRQDPDVIMIGEIRDQETAKTANQAALTGHLVLATLHTDTALSAIPRLLDMGVEHYLLASTLKALLSQRLVRQLCKTCRQFKPLSDDEKVVLKHWSHLPDNTQLANQHAIAVGCADCDNTGFSGRIAVAELILVDSILREAITKDSSASELSNCAEATRNSRMTLDAIQKIENGEIMMTDALRMIPSEQVITK